MPALERLTADHAGDIVSVFCDAFHDYPVMRYVVGSQGDYDARLRHLIAFFVGRRVQQGGPLFGMVENGRLLAAATTTLPEEPLMPPGAASLRDETWRQLGEDARDRYETYAAATKVLAITPPHHHLNMIGVRATQKGQKWPGRCWKPSGRWPSRIAIRPASPSRPKRHRTCRSISISDMRCMATSACRLSSNRGRCS